MNQAFPRQVAYDNLGNIIDAHSGRVLFQPALNWKSRDLLVRVAKSLCADFNTAEAKKSYSAKTGSAINARAIGDEEPGDVR